MKSFLLQSFSAVLLAVSISACSSDFGSDTVNSRFRFIAASIDGRVPATRSAIDPTSYGDGAVGILWTPDDALGVFSDSESNVRFDNTADGNQGRTVFSGNLAGNSMYAYYPYSEDNAGRNAADLIGNLPLTQCFDPVTGKIDGDWKFGVPRIGAEDEFDFKHMFSLFKISVNASGTPMEGETLKKVVLELPENRALGGDFSFSAVTGDYTMSHSEGSNVIAMEWSGDATLAAGEILTGYVSCAPDIKTDDRLDLKVITDKRTASFTALAAYDFEGGAIYTFDLNLSELAQKFDVKYEELPVEPEEETANCYMINSAGEHDFKATVIGNGAKGIIPGAGFHTDNPYINPKSARLLWEDTEGFVSDVRLVDGRVHYTTTGNSGNAVIAVYDDAEAAGRILWSWHIWGVGPNLPEDDELTNYDGAKFQVMNRTLGSLAENPNKLTLYQWGRKDPFPNDSVVWMKGDRMEIDTSDYHYFNVRNFSSRDDEKATIAESVADPTCFFNRSKNLSSGNWLNSEILNLWGNSLSAAEQRQSPNSQSDVKTIYDPSPVGYRVANCQTFSGFSKHEGGSNGSVENTRLEWINQVGYDHGYYFMRNSDDVVGTLFPMSGSRGGYFGMTHSYSGNGNKRVYYWNGDLVGWYWYSNPAPATAGAGRSVHLYLTRYVEFNTGGTAVNSNNRIDCYYTSDRSVAMAVRCVRE